MTQTTDMLKVQLGAVADSKSRTLLKTIRSGDIPRGFESHALRLTSENQS